MIFTVDPGASNKNGEASAFALGSSAGLLLDVGFQKRGEPYRSPAMFGTIETVVVERPEYQGARSDGSRTTDLLALSWCGAAVAFRTAGHYGARVVEVTPSEWKGGQRKPQHHTALWRILSEAERELLGGHETERIIREACVIGATERWKKGGGAAYYPAWFTLHNVLDAVALLKTFTGAMPSPRNWTPSL